MRYLIEPSVNGWVAVSDNYSRDDSEEKVKERLMDDILEKEMWLNDIDALAKVPTMDIALKAVGTTYANPDYLKWLSVLSMTRIVNDKDAEADCWQRYSSKFLRNKDDEIKNFIAPKIEKSLYPGAKDFFFELDCWKYFITRNLERVGKEYKKTLSFTRFFHETNDKEDLAKRLFLAHPHRKQYAVSGNDVKDLVMVDTLRYYGCKVVSFQVSDSSKEFDEQFDVSIGKNYDALLKIINVD